MQKRFIQTQAEFTALCESLSAAKLLTVDTEFVRTRTLVPKLGLLQVCDGEQVALIDPLALDDLSPFWQLLENPAITKVLHACSEDLEVFLTAGAKPPQNLIDSQVMMTFLGHGLSLGYAAMVKHYLDIELDKSESRTDWTKRPLTDNQLKYAAADVEHLYTLFPKLLADIEAKGWLAASQQESANMIAKKYQAIDPDTLYQNVKLAWKLSPKQLNNLKFLASWRYQKAVTKDQPLSFIAKDHTLQLVAQRSPMSVRAMANIEGVEALDVRYQGKAMINVLKQAAQTPEDAYPAKLRRLDEYPGYKQTFKQVKHFLQQVADKHELAIECLASKKQINQFLSFYFKLNGADQSPAAVDLINSWRKPIAGEALIEFADGGFK
ncbi:ribonuclease D [Thalassotalea euphylliae]|uniref:Ribonuclease D n=1 Tax=Thalassotalea euphylliae TaxID=1655234 RepID=A0A3E0UHH9_9GAMM|nr:ribonuclease D [Thalassotalea euphylliae]REL36063.1 ribonuclease D [Thalassotalea euphylliae]